MNTDKQIKVSILMPIYKVEMFLERTLDSIFTQSYSNIDYVFVNDCSPDNSLQVLKNTIAKYEVEESRYTIVNHQKNEGIAVSRADCLANAKGDYVYFVDSDDWIEKDAVEKMVSATKEGTIDIVGCDFMKDYMSGKTTYHHENYAETCRENMLRCLNYDIATVLWKLLIRRSLFDEFIICPINIGEDYIISVKLYYYAKSFVSLNKAFYHYVQYNQNRLSFHSLQSIYDHIDCVKIIESFLGDKGICNNELKELLLLRKFNIKSNFVLNKKLLSEKSYKDTFPEAKGVWKKMNYSRIECVKFWIAEHGLFVLLKIL